MNECNCVVKVKYGLLNYITRLVFIINPLYFPVVVPVNVQLHSIQCKTQEDTTEREKLHFHSRVQLSDNGCQTVKVPVGLGAKVMISAFTDNNLTPLNLNIALTGVSGWRGMKHKDLNPKLSPSWLLSALIPEVSAEPFYRGKRQPLKFIHQLWTQSFYSEV